jgi:periplasmic protein TonB
VRGAVLAPAFLTSLLVHATGLLGVALLWGSLQLHTARPDLIPAEVVIAPPPAPEPVPVPDAEPLTPPTALTRADVALTRPLPRVPTVPLTPTHIEPIPPPKAAEKVLPKPTEPRPKPLPTAQRPLPGPPPGPEAKTFEKPKPGLSTPMPDEGPASPGANSLGPSTATKPADQPAKSVEGGEAGAGELSERGELPVAPGIGVGGGSGGPGRAGLGAGAEGNGGPVGGLRPGAGGEGPGGGVSSLARPLSGYQLLPRYPDSARRQGITGTTTLLFEVLENGRVGEIRIEHSAGHPDLDQAAVEAIKKWRFEPARRGHQAVAVWLRMPVKFVLR